MKYTVTLLYDASVSVEVEADSADEAVEKAYDEHEGVSLCYQCANDLELGDVNRHFVYDHNHKLVIESK